MTREQALDGPFWFECHFVAVAGRCSLRSPKLPVDRFSDSTQRITAIVSQLVVGEAPSSTKWRQGRH